MGMAKYSNHERRGAEITTRGTTRGTTKTRGVATGIASAIAIALLTVGCGGDDGGAAAATTETDTADTADTGQETTTVDDASATTVDIPTGTRLTKEDFCTQYDALSLAVTQTENEVPAIRDVAVQAYAQGLDALGLVAPTELGDDLAVLIEEAKATAADPSVTGTPEGIDAEQFSASNERVTTYCHPGR
jgi:hypothetical protein